MSHIFSNHIFYYRIRIKRSQNLYLKKARLDAQGLVGWWYLVVVWQRVVFSARLSFVWVGDFFGFDQVLDRMFEFEAIVCGVSSGLVEFVVGVWIVVG